MKQYKLIIRENCSENLGGIVNSQAKSGWRLNSYESSRQDAANDQAGKKQRVVLVFEK